MFAALHLPRFALQSVLRHEPEGWAQSVALVDPTLSTPRVIELTQPALAAGVEAGMTAPQAIARCPGLHVRHRSIRVEEETEAAVIQTSHGFSPNLEWTGPGWVTLDLRGLGEFGKDPARDRLLAWGERWRLATAALGLTGRIGVGPTPGVARHAAVEPATDPVRVVLAAEAERFIASLPVSVLEPTPHVAGQLAQWGIRSVGEFRALGQGELAERLGLEAFALWAAASATATRPLRLARVREDFTEGRELEPAVETLEPLLFLLRRFVDSLEVRLKAAGFAAGSLVLRLKQESGDVLERRLRVPQPTARADVLFRMLHTHLEGVRTQAAIAALHLEAEPPPPSQNPLSHVGAAQRDTPPVHETHARLSALVGADRVGSPLRREGHRPDSFQLVPPDFENAPSLNGRRLPELLRPTPVRRLRPALSAVVETRPDGPPTLSSGQVAAWLDPLFKESPPDPAVPPAQPVETTAVGGGTVLPFPGSTAVREPQQPDPPGSEPGRPWNLRCAVAQGRVTVSVGPWRSSGHWWDAGAWSRVEWDISVRDAVPLRLAWTGSEWQVEALMD